jgi:hypothetical protein
MLRQSFSCSSIAGRRETGGNGSLTMTTEGPLVTIRIEKIYGSLWWWTDQPDATPEKGRRGWHGPHGSAEAARAAAKWVYRWHCPKPIILVKEES